MKKRIIFFVTFAVLNCFLCTSVHGLKPRLEQSLFLPEGHWLLTKITESFQGKEYKKLLSTVVSTTDCEHVIVCKYGSNKLSTDIRGNTLIQIPLKPKNEGATYKDCENKNGGDVALSVSFKKAQGATLEEENFVTLGLGSASYSIVGQQKEIDEKLDSSIQGGEYAWINEGGVTRTLIAPIGGGYPLGYLIEKEDGSKKVFWATVHYCSFGIKQYEFKEWSVIKKCFDINNAQSSMFGTGWS
ncbi:MAG: hypothetical protein LBS28_03500 [Streptococcaceae bacterium]|jgi:hypothetical protein|nr:hypothetical protein [Streptococcaceae bacterium]